MKVSDHWCRNCGARAAHAHHALPRSICREGVKEPLNIVPLCEDCHRGWHDGYLTLYRDIFIRSEWCWILDHADEVWLDRRYPRREHDLPF